MTETAISLTARREKFYMQCFNNFHAFSTLGPVTVKDELSWTQQKLLPVHQIQVIKIRTQKSGCKIVTN